MRGDRIARFIPFGIDLSVICGYGTANCASSIIEQVFLFGGLSPPNKKWASLRPLRLCVENPILDKSDPKSKHEELTPEQLKQLKKVVEGEYL